MSLDTTNQGISDQLSDIQQNLQRTFTHYDEKLRLSRYEGIQEVPSQIKDTRETMEAMHDRKMEYFEHKIYTVIRINEMKVTDRVTQKLS